MSRLNKDYTQVPLQSELDSIARIIMAKLTVEKEMTHTPDRLGSHDSKEYTGDLFLTHLDEEQSNFYSQPKTSLSSHSAMQPRHGRKGTRMTHADYHIEETIVGDSR